MAEPDRYDADAWGVHVDWTDAEDTVRTVSDETVAALHEVIGDPPDDLDDRAPLVTRPGARLGLGSVEVDCEDGQTRTVDDVLPDDFPLGYHRLRKGGRSRRLIVSPGRCWEPPGSRAWGWTVQLYATCSRDSWGIGDLADLATIRGWAERCGAGFLMVNPLHAVAPLLPQETSPYLPATRRFRNPVYLRVEDVPGAEHVDLSAWRPPAGPGGGAPEEIDRDLSWEAKRDALTAVFDAVSSVEGWDEDLARWRRDQGGSLEEFATWCVLTEMYGADWHAWPTELQAADSPDAARIAAEQQPRVTFYAWLQWLLDTQLRAASGSLTVIQDLPIGVDGGGADAWAWRDALASGVTVGAPPDLFNRAGQDWGSPPFVPWRLRDADYQPFIESIRATMAAGGGIRIDHVMGLFRLWWVPQGASPADGAYVRYPSRDLLDIVALESQRNRSVVVGEDLGTVEPGVRETLSEYGVLSYRLLWFEEQEPSTWPSEAMAAVTTHDLPTVAGLWSGSDLDEQRRYVDVEPAQLEKGRDQLLEALTRPTGLSPTASTQEAVLAAYRALAQAPSRLLSATLEDAVAAERRPNLPGTVARDNWSIPLPVTVEELVAHPLAQRLAATLQAALTDEAEPSS